ncbi:hypothetical protein ACVW17_001202 [Bradyrhizobium sp. USDA 4473]
MALTVIGIIAVTGHEYDRNMNVGLGQLRLKVEPAQPGQPDVQDQAARDIRKLVLQKFMRRPEHGGPQADRPEQIVQCVPHRGIVVDDEHDRILGVCGRRCGASSHHA